MIISFKKIPLFIKIVIYFFIFIFLIIGIYKLTSYKTQRNIIKLFPQKFEFAARILFQDPFDIRTIQNDYNVRFLPYTQFLELELQEKFFDFDIEKSKNLGMQKHFFLEIIDNDIWLIKSSGSVKKINYNDIANNITEKIKTSNIQSNLKEKILVVDSYVHDKKIYLSFVKHKDACETLNIIFAEINNESLNFQNYFNSKECTKGLSSGRMQFFEHNNMGGLLVTTATGVADKPTKQPQDDDSIYGKLLFIDFKTKKVINFSKGHRTQQGLYAEKNLILSTEHGPSGGDEINKIIFNKNYGWPLSSYGEPYSYTGYFSYDSIDKKNKKLGFYKSHSDFSFEEPVFSFVPSIGISELIKLPNDFSNQWVDNFIVTSLNARSIFRIKFDNNYKKISFYEKIYIGQRIRDIKYHHELGAILLVLEDKGQLGILKKE